jgi:hypothetical protein
MVQVVKGSRLGPSPGKLSSAAKRVARSSRWPSFRQGGAAIEFVNKIFDKLSEFRLHPMTFVELKLALISIQYSPVVLPRRRLVRYPMRALLKDRIVFDVALVRRAVASRALYEFQGMEIYKDAPPPSSVR